MLKRLVLCCFLLIPRAADLPAQYRSGQRGIGLRLGASPYDLDATGTAVVLGPQVDYALSKTLVGELGIILFDHYATEDFGGGVLIASNRTRLLLPELSLQAQARIGRFQPYILGGGGVAIRLNGSVAGGNTLHGGLGTRIRVGESTMLRFEARARAIGSAGETVDLTAGIEWVSD